MQQSRAGPCTHPQTTPQAFSHWTHEVSGGSFMVTDLQGVRDPSSGAFTLCDPAIHCPADLLRFTRTNLGEEGCTLFFETHRWVGTLLEFDMCVGWCVRWLWKRWALKTPVHAGPETHTCELTSEAGSDPAEHDGPSHL